MTPSLTLWKYELEWERRVEEAEATGRARAAATREHGIDERIFLDRLALRLAEPSARLAATQAPRRRRGPRSKELEVRIEASY